MKKPRKPRSYYRGWYLPLNLSHRAELTDADRKRLGTTRPTVVKDGEPLPEGKK